MACRSYFRRELLQCATEVAPTNICEPQRLRILAVRNYLILSNSSSNTRVELG